MINIGCTLLCSGDKSHSHIHNVCSCQVFCSAWRFIEATLLLLLVACFAWGCVQALAVLLQGPQHIFVSKLDFCYDISSHSVNKKAGLVFNSYQV